MSKNNYNAKIEACQGDSDKLLDLELSDKFGKHKKQNEILVDSYSRIYTDQFGVLDEKYEKKIKRLSDCATYIQFRKPLVDGGKWRLYHANFCRERLCPVCSWRKGLKIYSHVSKIMDHVQDDYIYLFLTLTVPNCEGLELNNSIDTLLTSFKKLMKYKKVKSAVCGYFRVLEITHNTDKKYHIWKKSKTGKKYKVLARDLSGNTYPNPFFDTYHPHIHCILAVRKKYFKDFYIPQSEWLEMWRKATKDNTITQVNIKRCTPKDLLQGEKVVSELGNISMSDAVREVAKYSVKGSDFLYINDNDLTDRTVLTLSTALYHRRLFEFGGVFDDVYKLLNLDDPDTGDLILVDGSELRSDVGFMIRFYNWGSGAYGLTNEMIFEEEKENDNSEVLKNES